MKKSNVVTEGALFSGIYIILLLITVFVPLVSYITIFLTPVPFILYVYKNGLKPGLIMFMVTLLISSVFATVFSMPLTIFAALGGITIGAGLHARKSTYENWAIGSVAFALGFLIVFALGQWMMDIHLMDELNSMINSTMNTSEQVMEELGYTQDELMEAMREQINQIFYLMPTLFAFIGIIFAFLTIWISYKIINRLYSDHGKLSFPPFREFRLPIAVIWYYLFALILTWIFPEQGELLNQAGVNVATLIGFLFVLQGLSFIFYYIHVKKMTKTLAVVAIIAAVIMPIFLYLLRILGIIDLGFNLRDRLNPNKK
ncbi:YybS family protein [Salinibacillus aidingensis]|uniref:YybS family protein n=1 Tax=Salinibacillus aidingensis TaxID=237684 RepID=A0ABN1BQV7_9BACI